MAEEYPLRLLLPLEFASMQGGAPQSVELMVRYLVALGLIPQVLCPENEVAQAMSDAGAKVHTTKGLEVWSLDPGQPALLAGTLRKVLPALRKFSDRVSIVHSQDLVGQILTATALVGCPTPQVFTYCRNEPEGFKYRLLKPALNGCAGVVTTTQYQVSVLTDAFNIPRQRITVIPNATDLHLRDPLTSTLREDLGLAADDFVIAVPSYILPLKNQELLLQAAPAVLEKVPRARFVIAGEPGSPGGNEYLEHLNKLCDAGKLTGKVIFPGFIKDKPSLFQAADVIVSTSLREGFGMSLIEAMACKKPVVACDIGGPASIIRDRQNGLLVPDDPRALADALIRLATEPALYTSLAEQGYDEIQKKYDARVVARSYIRLYRKVLDIKPDQGDDE